MRDPERHTHGNAHTLMTEVDNTELNRLLALIEFAEQCARLRSTPPSAVSQHPFALHEFQVQGLPGVHVSPAEGDEGDEVWLRIDRLHETRPPAIEGAHLQPWVEMTRSCDTEPKLRPTVSGSELIAAGTHIAVTSAADGRPAIEPEQAVILEEFETRPRVESDFNRYVSRLWRPWANEEKARRATIKLYSRLFTLKQQLEDGVGEAPLEMVWGTGVMLWKHTLGELIYPLLTTVVDVVLDPDTAALEMRPRAEPPRVEGDWFTAHDISAIASVERATKEFFEKPEAYFSAVERSTFEPLLRLAVTHLDPAGQYVPDIHKPEDRSLPRIEQNLKVTDTWALFARPRTNSQYVLDLQRIKKLIADAKESGIALPGAVRAVVTDPVDSTEEVDLPVFRGVSLTSSRDGSGSQKAKDLFFPKAFNEEQVRIVQLLESSDGVVVQGPPGTGKTHTIANVICHYLAKGQKILVTSMKEPALAVLREQLPAEIRPLVISLLTSERDGMKQFEHSIGKIAAEVQSLDRRVLAAEIAELQRKVDSAHAKLAGVDRDIGNWAKRNLEPARLDGEEVHPETAAKQIVEGRDQFEWLPDHLGITEDFKPQFGHADLVSLREARRSLAGDMEYFGKLLPIQADLPDAGTLLRVHQDLTQSVLLKRELDGGAIPQLASSSNEHLSAAQELLKTAETIATLRAEIAGQKSPWTISIRERLRSGSHVQTVEILEALGLELQAAVDDRNGFLTKPVFCPPRMEVDSELIEAVQNMAQGKRPFGLIGLIGKNEQKGAIGKISVLGAAPATESDWQHVGSYLELQKRLRTLAIRWNALAPELGFDVVEGDDPESGLAAANAFKVFKLVARVVDLERAAERKAAFVFPAWSEAARIANDSSVFELMERALRHHLTSNRLANVWVVRSNLEKSLDGRNGAISTRIRSFLTTTLGSPEIPVEHMQANWSALMAELSRVTLLGQLLKSVAEVTEKMAASGAVKWAEALRQPLQTPVDSLLPDNWPSAWRLRRLATHLEENDPGDELGRLGKERLQLENTLRRAYEALVTKRTWLKMSENATALVRAELQAYLAAIRKIGKGTGKSAGRYRLDARRAAQGAQPAVPCWIMPHHRVSESLPSQLGSFDLVIVDEASQSDLACLPALLRAKKVLIVGDDKQVSPEGVGLEEDKIRSLMNRFLQDQVATYKPQMAPSRSMYDLFKVVFAKSSAMLREHFRCVGPIIEYSKREVYGHELRPLRIPRKSERLDPPLVDVLIEDGYRNGDINRPEADFIVEEIKRLVADPALANRSIGVVSLLAEKQALLVWQRLTDEIGPEAISKHRIACGDARTFQGKERDIMFLSMVCAPNDLGAALTRDTFEQRFNVAASRARDRMYLVRSVELEQLSPADTLRRGLITHFSSPFVKDEQRVEDLKKLCESDFERDVYDDLTTRGYRVTPQVGADRYRIDMVVEGNSDARLAVECDGDMWHGPERWEADMQRQRTLERAGWTFWRSFASAYYRRREEVLEDLLRKLGEHGIEPVSTADLPKSRHTELRRVRENKDARTDTTCPNAADLDAGREPEKSEAAKLPGPGLDAKGHTENPEAINGRAPNVEANSGNTERVPGQAADARRQGALKAWSNTEFRAGGSARAKKAVQTRARRIAEKNGANGSSRADGQPGRNGTGSRPYLSSGILQLEKMFEARGADRSVLQCLLEELSCRKTDRAAALLRKVEAALGAGRSFTQMPLIGDAMDPKDIKTRRQLTGYLYQQLSSGVWGRMILANFDSGENWTDDPVSQQEVAAAIRNWRREASEG